MKTKQFDKLLVIVMLMLITITSAMFGKTTAVNEWKDGDVFEANTIEGIEMEFKVISAKDKTCQVGVGNLEGPGVRLGDYVAIDNWNTVGKVTIPQKVMGFDVVKIADGAFYACWDVTSIVVPEGVSSIGLYAFADCEGKIEVSLPNSLNYIGNRAFDGSAIEKITIPANCTLGNYLFDLCLGLKDIYSKSESPSDAGDAFESTYDYQGFSIYNNATLHIPVGTMSKYKLSQGWKNFKNIVEVGGETPSTIYVSSITLVPSSLSIEVGKGQSLQAIVYPDNATNKSVMWSSSNTSVATVSSDGYVYAKSEGTATITWTANDGSGVSARCTIAVTAPQTKGDVNGDGSVNGTDLVVLTNMILGKSEKKSAADVNGDGEVNGTDYVTLVNIVLGKK